MWREKLGASARALKQAAAAKAELAKAATVENFPATVAAAKAARGKAAEKAGGIDLGKLHADIKTSAAAATATASAAATTAATKAKQRAASAMVSDVEICFEEDGPLGISFGEFEEQTERGPVLVTVLGIEPSSMAASALWHHSQRPKLRLG
jgi:hypothetical protein